MNVGERVRIKNNGQFGIIVNTDYSQSHSGVTVLTYCEGMKDDRPQFFPMSELKVHSESKSLKEDLEEILANVKF